MIKLSQINKFSASFTVFFDKITLHRGVKFHSSRVASRGKSRINISRFWILEEQKQTSRNQNLEGIISRRGLLEIVNEFEMNLLETISHIFTSRGKIKNPRAFFSLEVPKNNFLQKARTVPRTKNHQFFCFTIKKMVNGKRTIFRYGTFAIKIENGKRFCFCCGTVRAPLP